MSQGWIGVDLDGTLAEYNGWSPDGSIGAPIAPMLKRVKQWLAEGKDVRIFTARVAVGVGGEQRLLQHKLGWSEECDHTEADCQDWIRQAQAQLTLIETWCLAHIGQRLRITCVKDFTMTELWDDRCVAVEQNTGNAFSWRWSTNAPADEFTPYCFDEGAGWNPPEVV